MDDSEYEMKEFLMQQFSAHVEMASAGARSTVKERMFEFLIVFSFGAWIVSVCAVMYCLHIHFSQVYESYSQVQEARDFWGGVFTLPLLLGWVVVAFLGVSPFFSGQMFRSWLSRSESRMTRAVIAFVLGIGLAAMMTILPFSMIGIRF